MNTRILLTGAQPGEGGGGAVVPKIRWPKRDWREIREEKQEREKRREKRERVKRRKKKEREEKKK